MYDDLVTFIFNDYRNVHNSFMQTEEKEEQEDVNIQYRIPEET